MGGAGIGARCARLGSAMAERDEERGRARPSSARDAIEGDSRMVASRLATMGDILVLDVRMCFPPFPVGAAGPSGTLLAVGPCTGHAACASSSVRRRDCGGDCACACAGGGKVRPRLCACRCLLDRRRTTVSFDVLAKGRDGEVVMPLQVHSVSSAVTAAGSSTASTESTAEALLLGLGGRGHSLGESGAEGAYVGAMEIECRRRVCAGFARVIAGSRPRGRCGLARCGEYCEGALQPVVGVLTDLNVDATPFDVAVQSDSPVEDSTSARASWTWIESLEMPRSAFGRVRARLRGRKGCGQKNELSPKHRRHREHPDGETAPSRWRRGRYVAASWRSRTKKSERASAAGAEPEEGEERRARRGRANG